MLDATSSFGALLGNSVLVQRDTALGQRQRVDDSDNAIDSGASFTAGQAKAFNSGCGSARPEVSMTMASSGRSRDQQLVHGRHEIVGHGAADAAIGELDDIAGAQAFCRSIPRPDRHRNRASPNSLTITAMRRAVGLVSSEAQQRGLAGAEKSGEDGDGDAGHSILLGTLQPERKPGCDERNIQHGGRDRPG